MMVETKVIRIGRALFVPIPPEEARRLGLKEDSPVDIQVKLLHRSVKDVLRYKGAFRGQFASRSKNDQWNDE